MLFVRPNGLGKLLETLQVKKNLRVVIVSKKEKSEMFLFCSEYYTKISFMLFPRTKCMTEWLTTILFNNINNKFFIYSDCYRPMQIHMSAFNHTPVTKTMRS
jgi:hypothetical protein